MKEIFSVKIAGRVAVETLRSVSMEPLKIGVADVVLEATGWLCLLLVAWRGQCHGRLWSADSGRPQARSAACLVFLSVSF